MQTSLWPDEPVELEGKRIGIVGTGFVGGAGDPRARQGRRAPHGVPAHGGVHVAVAEPAAHRRRAGRGEGAVPRAARGAVRVVQRHRGHHRRGDLRLPDRRPAHPREHARRARSRARGARVQRVPHLDRHRDRSRRQRDGRRAVPRDGAAHGEGSRRRRVALAARLPARLQASGARLELLRDLQPRQRDPRRPAQGPDRGGHRRRASAPSSASWSSTCSCSRPASTR